MLGFRTRNGHEYVVGDIVPGIVDANEKQQESRASNAKQGLAGAGGSSE
jgi:hypothetical protein